LPRSAGRVSVAPACPLNRGAPHVGPTAGGVAFGYPVHPHAKLAGYPNGPNSSEVGTPSGSEDPAGVRRRRRVLSGLFCDAARLVSSLFGADQRLLQPPRRLPPAGSARRGGARGGLERGRETPRHPPIVLSRPGG